MKRFLRSLQTYTIFELILTGMMICCTLKLNKVPRIHLIKTFLSDFVYNIFSSEDLKSELKVKATDPATTDELTELLDALEGIS